MLADAKNMVLKQFMWENDPSNEALPSLDFTMFHLSLATVLSRNVQSHSPNASSYAMGLVSLP